MLARFYRTIQGNEGAGQLVPDERDRNQRNKGSGRAVPETKVTRKSGRAGVTWTRGVEERRGPRVLNASLPHQQRIKKGTLAIHRGSRAIRRRPSFEIRLAWLT